MPDQVTKIILRRGSLQTGRTITLNQGEPGFTTDTRRLYIGTGNTQLGAPIGIRNYGIKNFSGLNFNQTFSGSEIGDIVYDDFSNHVFFLTAYDGTSQSNWAKIDFVVNVDDTTIELNSASAIQLKNFGIQTIHLNSNIIGNGLLGAAGAPIRVDVDNISIDINNNKLRVIPGAIPIDYLGTINPFTVLGNSKNFNSVIEAIPINNGQVLARLGNTFGGVNFDQIVANGGAVAAITTTSPVTGVIDNTVFPNTVRIGLNSNIITAASNLIELKAQTDITGLLTVNGNTRVTGDIVAYYSSDSKLKNNVTNITDCLEKIKHINGVEFEWNEKSGYGGKDVGVIAQEVEKVQPLVVTTRNDGYKAVRYEKLIPLLVNAVKELSEKVDELNKKINE